MDKPDDMDARICMVTGASSGIGLATARMLAAKGAQVVMVCRNADKGRAAQSEITRRTGSTRVDLLLADLSIMASVRDLAEQCLRRYDRLDVLIHNAGVMKPRREVTADGFEVQFAVHHLAPFLLTHRLLDLMRRRPGARVISVTSKLHTYGKLDFDDLQFERRYNMLRAYGTSKLANIMFTYQMAERLQGQGITVNCLHPGVIGSNLEVYPRFVRPLMKRPETGADTPVYLASSQEVADVTGRYFMNRKPRKSSRESYDRAKQQRLWEVTEALLSERGVRAAA